MKVVHVFNELKFSGAEIMYVDAAMIFQSNGCELTALATAQNVGEYAANFKQAGYKLQHRPYPSLKKYLKRISYYGSFIRFLKKEKYDVVHIHRNDAMWGISLCAWLAGKKSVYTFHNVFQSGKYTFLYHYLLRWSAKKIFKCRFQTISDSVFNNELKLFHNATTKIYNWYGTNRFYPASQDEKLSVRQELNIPENAFVIISVGGCSTIKRHSDIINALSLIIKNVPDSIYLHLGTGTTENKEQDLAKQLDVYDAIRFLGNKNDIRKYLIASDVYLMTSRFEGISLTSIEAMACNIPAILYDVPGLRDFNKNGENCILIPEDYQLVSEKLVEINNNSLKYLQMRKRAELFVNSVFSMETNAAQIFHLYQEL